MSLTRKYLNTLKLEPDVVELIIEAHSETVEALKKQRDDAIAEAGNASELARERNELQQQLEALRAQGGDAAKVQAEFDAFKTEVAAREQAAQTEADVLALLTECGVTRQSFQSMAAKAFDRNRIQRDAEGKIANRDELHEYIKTDFGDCIATTTTGGTPPADPPAGGAKKLTVDQIRAMKPEEINANWAAVQAALRG